MPTADSIASLPHVPTPTQGWGEDTFLPLSPTLGDTVQRGPAVTFVATSRADGGIERYSVQMATALARHGMPLQFACRTDGSVEQACHMANISTVTLAPRNSGDVHAAFRLAGFLAAQGTDIVHVHSRRDFLPILLAVILARRRGLPDLRLVLHAHMIRPLGSPPALSSLLFAKHADKIVCVSDAVHEFLMKERNLPLSKVVTLHNGVDLSKFAAAGTGMAQEWRSEFRREWGITPDAPVIVMVGRLDAKGQMTLIEALPLLSVRFPTLRLVLVGADGIEGERERLLSRARASDVADKIVFTGPRDDVSRVLAACDVLVHLPTDEAFGLALAEAMAAGLPTVASSTGGCPEVVQNGVTGFVVPPGDKAALTAALEPLLCGEKGKRLRTQMGSAGRSAAANTFSLPRQMDKLWEMYSALCPAPSGQ